MGEYLPIGRSLSAADIREWIRTHLTSCEELAVSRAVMDLPAARWRVFDRAEGYAVVTNRRAFIVHLTGAYSGRTSSSEMLAPQIVREAPLADVLVIARRPDDRTVYAHLGRDSRRLRFHKAGDASDFEKAVREDTDPTTSSTGAVSIERDRSPAFDSLSTLDKADPETFVKALMEGRWRDVLTKPDHDPVLATFETAIESDADGFLVGFAIRGTPTRLVWANVEVIRAGILSPGELQPDPGPGTAAFDMRLAGLVFVEDPQAEPSDLRPSLLADRPWVLMPYPGPVSWSSLLRTAAYLLP